MVCFFLFGVQLPSPSLPSTLHPPNNTVESTVYTKHFLKNVSSRPKRTSLWCVYTRNAKVSRGHVNQNQYLPEDLLLDGAGVVASMYPARMVRRCAAVMHVVACQTHKEVAPLAIARPDAGAR